MELYFIKCKIDDFDEFFMLRRDDENILWTGHKKIPDKNKLKDWFYKQLNREDRIIFLAKSSETKETVGYLYIDIVEEKNNIIEISHGIHSKFKGNGLGTKNVKYAIDYVKLNLVFIDQLDAWIASNNIGSVKTFLKNGFSKTNEIKMIFFEGFNEKIEMQKFVYEIQR